MSYNRSGPLLSQTIYEQHFEAMTKNNKSSKEKEQAPRGTSSGLEGWLPFLLIAGILLAIVIQQVVVMRGADHNKVQVLTDKQQARQDLLALHDKLVSEEAKLRAEVRESNIALGIDPEYPSFKFPLYPGLEILEAKREEAQSTLGETMDMWYIHGQVDADLKDIEQFYRDALQAAELRQTQYISIPNGYAFNYANEWYDTKFTIEKKHEDPMPQLEITVYRVQDDSVKIGD